MKGRRRQSVLAEEKPERETEGKGQRDTAIRAPTRQDVTCGEQEEETGQI